MVTPCRSVSRASGTCCTPSWYGGGGGGWQWRTRTWELGAWAQFGRPSLHTRNDTNTLEHSNRCGQVTGLKCWHLRDDCQFYTRRNFEFAMRR